MSRSEPAAGAVAYVRTGRSLAQSADAQRQAIRRLAKSTDTKIAHWHVEEGDPPSIEDRPALMQALASLAQSPPQVLLVASPEVVSEASWEEALVERLASHVGGRVLYAAGKAARDAVPSEFRAALGVHERMLLRLRMIIATEIQRPRGAMWGRCPWGYRFSADGMHLEPHEGERTVVAVARHMRLRGLKLRQIRDELIKLGVVGRTGRPLGITRIYELLDEGQGSRLHVLAARAAADPDAPPASSVRPSLRPGAAAGDPGGARQRRRASGQRRPHE